MKLRGAFEGMAGMTEWRRHSLLGESGMPFPFKRQVIQVVSVVNIFFWYQRGTLTILAGISIAKGVNSQDKLEPLS